MVSTGQCPKMQTNYADIIIRGPLKERTHSYSEFETAGKEEYLIIPIYRKFVKQSWDSGRWIKLKVASEGRTVIKLWEIMNTNDEMITTWVMLCERSRTKAIEKSDIWEVSRK